MAKKKKSKITMLKDYQKKDPLRKLYQEGADMLAKGTEPYLVAMNLLLKRVHLLLEKSEPNVENYFNKFKLEPMDDLHLNGYDALDYNIGAYGMSISMMYLFSTSKGQAELKKIVDWMPPEIDKETVLQWQENYIFSVFIPKNAGGKLNFIDFKDKKVYPTKEAYQFLDLEDDHEDDLYMMVMLVPLPDGTYLDTQGAICPLDLKLQKVLSGKLEKGVYAEKLLYYFRDFLEELMMMERDDDEEFMGTDCDYYPLERFSGESDRQFARRLLKQEDDAEAFPEPKMMEDLLVKIIQKFPQLILPRANALALVQGIIEVFVNPDPDETDKEEDELRGEDLSHFWYLLIVEYFPEEVRGIKKMMDASGFWDEENFSDDFDPDDMPF